MNYIKKIAKRILAKDYDIVKRNNWMNDCVLLLNDNGLRWTMKKRYKHFLYFIVASQKWKCKRGQECYSSTVYIEYLAGLFNIKDSTLKFYLREMVKDKILIGPDNPTFSEEAYWFNKTYFDTYLLTDYKTLEE